MKKDDLSYMDCWHIIAPIFTTAMLDQDYFMKAYVMIFKALKDADEREK